MLPLLNPCGFVEIVVQNMKIDFCENVRYSSFWPDSAAKPVVEEIELDICVVLGTLRKECRRAVLGSLKIVANTLDKTDPPTAMRHSLR